MNSSCLAVLSATVRLGFDSCAMQAGKVTRQCMPTAVGSLIPSKLEFPTSTYLLSAWFVLGDACKHALALSAYTPFIPAAAHTSTRATIAPANSAQSNRRLGHGLPKQAINKHV